MPKPPTPQCKIDEALRLYQSGASAQKAANQVGCGKQAVLRALKARGIAARDTHEWTRGVPRVVSQEQIATACEVYSNHGVTTVSLAKEFGVSRQTIRQWLFHNKVPIKPKGGENKLSDEQCKQIGKMYSEGASREELRKIFGVNKETVSRYCKIVDVARRDCRYQRVYSCNDVFFQTLNAVSCYIIGFLSADGYVSDKGHISITQSMKDKAHIENILKLMDCNYPVTDTQMKRGAGAGNFYSRVTILSPQMAQDLAALGVTPRKSLTIEPCPHIPPAFQRDYLRGLVDGDGWVRKDKRRPISGVIGLCGTPSIVRYFQEYAHNITGTRAQLKPVGKIAYFNVCGVKGPALLADALYRNAPIALERKAKIARELMHFPIK